MLAEAVVVPVVSDDQLLRVELVTDKDRRPLGLDDLDRVTKMLCESSQLNLEADKNRDFKLAFFRHKFQLHNGTNDFQIS